VINQFAIAFVCTTIYAVIRYAGFGNVPLSHLPVYIMNKSVSMTATEALFMACLALMRSEKESVRFWADVCGQLVFVHVLLSLAILGKGYYPTFFDGDKMSLVGELVVLSGALGVYCLCRVRAGKARPAALRTLTVLVCTLVSGHLFAMGSKDWPMVSKWNGGLPPISLLAFLLVIAGLAVFLRTREKGASLAAEAPRCLPVES
jgi:hypothetical protein